MDEQQTSPAAARQPVEAWCAAKRTAAWLFGAAKAHQRWPVGLELTEAEYDDAITALRAVELR